MTRAVTPVSLPGLRDIHLPPPPGWWPPAPGWWILAAVLVIALITLVRRASQLLASRRRLRVALRSFDKALETASDAPERLAAASQMLRRATKRAHPGAAVLTGEAWLQFLDGDDPSRPFSNSPGSLLRDGAFQRRLESDIQPTLRLARSRFVELLGTDATGASARTSSESEHG